MIFKKRPVAMKGKPTKVLKQAGPCCRRDSRPSGRVGHSVILASVNFAQLLFPDFSLILCGYLICRFTAAQPASLATGRALGLFLLVPGVVVSLDCEKPVGLASGRQPDWCWPEFGCLRHCPVLQPALLANFGSNGLTEETMRPVRRWGSDSTLSSPWPWPNALPGRKVC